MSKREPEIRFKGYADDWEQHKLSKITKRVRGNDGRMTLPTLTISAGSGWLDQRERFSGNIAGKEQKNYTLLSKGELSYNHGNSKLAKYGAVFELRTYEEALVPRVYHSFKPTDEASSTFLEYMFATKIPDRELAKLITSGARMDGLLNINYNQFMSIKVNIPKIEEQILIAKFLRKLDKNIALHQQQLENLEKSKKAFLQKMFPKKGESVPEIRFKGFSGDWKQCKFKDVLETHSFKDYLAAPKENAKYMVIQQGDNPVLGFADGEPFRDYESVTLFGDHTVSLYKPENPFFVATDGLKILSAKQLNGTYLFTTLERYKPEPQGYKRHFTILKNVNIKYTVNKEEQKNIGDFFKQIDDTIAFSQMKLEQLKLTKKAFLQKMFV
jgi:type I restriction enzyme S subunit